MKILTFIQSVFVLAILYVWVYVLTVSIINGLLCLIIYGAFILLLIMGPELNWNKLNFKANKRKNTKEK